MRSSRGTGNIVPSDDHPEDDSDVRRPARGPSDRGMTGAGANLPFRVTFLEPRDQTVVERVFGNAGSPNAPSSPLSGRAALSGQCCSQAGPAVSQAAAYTLRTSRTAWSASPLG